MKKAISWLLVIALTATLAVGGTLAYLMDTDEDVNVMTVGQVKIDQLEYERVDTETKGDNAKVQEFHDNKPLFPAVVDKDNFNWETNESYVDWSQIGKDGYESGIWNPDEINNEVDKMVFVKNKGDFDAYVRTVIAFEAGNYTSLDQFQSKVHLNLNETDWKWEWTEEPITIGESKYFVATATYNKVLKPGALTEISLSQIALDPSATNEDVAGFGDTYQVLVQSQAVQVAGFQNDENELVNAKTALDEAFGTIPTEEDEYPFDNDSPTKGIGLKKAVQYYEGGSTKITGSVASVTFGLNKDYPDIVNNYTGTLVDVEQDLPAYAYYVKNGSTYDIYVLSNGTIYAPANSKNMFASMGKLKTVKGDLDVSRVTTMESMFDYCGSLQSVDSANWKPGKVTNMQYMFYGCGSLTDLDTSGWDMSSVTTMNQTFYGCTKLATLDVSGWDVGNVDFFYGTFFNCNSLTELDTSNWDTGKATNMSSMFANCTKLAELDVSGWDVGNVTTFLQTFAYCPALTELDVSEWDTSSATRMDFMFHADYNLETLDVSKWDVSKVTLFNHMFASDHQNWGDMKLTNVDVSNWNPVSAVNMGSLFYGCGQLTAVDMSGWNMPNLENLTHAFADCYKLETVNLTGWNTPALISMDAMFNHCKSMKSIDVSDVDTGTVREFSQLFEACSLLEEVIGLNKLDTSSGCTFTEMFNATSSLKVLDLSNFDTGSAYENYETLVSGKYSAFAITFSGMSSLEKLIIGEKVSFDGNGTVPAGNKLVLPAPASKAGFTAKWRNVETGELYLASEIPEGVAATYEAYYEAISNN